ncbi:hypothetical protein [Rhizobium sp. AAP43]|uniref:hypothetical protein n=1 Tax=Rhizobium sp. AAP43 TaxID=1523420 RepID=UPI0018D01BB5|nr:hypothetical protein [Rhizobium sp. AAP43]
MARTYDRSGPIADIRNSSALPFSWKPLMARVPVSPHAAGAGPVWLEASMDQRCGALSAASPFEARLVPGASG